jgi:hypothetical protein
MQHDVAHAAATDYRRVTVEGKNLPRVGTHKHSKGNHCDALSVIKSGENVKQREREQANRKHKMEQEPPLSTDMGLRCW